MHLFILSLFEWLLSQGFLWGHIILHISLQEAEILGFYIAEAYSPLKLSSETHLCLSLTWGDLNLCVCLSVCTLRSLGWWLYQRCGRGGFFGKSCITLIWNPPRKCLLLYACIIVLCMYSSHECWVRSLGVVIWCTLHPTLLKVIGHARSINQLVTVEWLQ